MKKTETTEQAERLTEYIIVRVTEATKKGYMAFCHRLDTTPTDRIREFVKAELAGKKVK